MTKRLDPDIKAIRAINRALSELPDDAHVQRVLEWTVARAAGKQWLTLPRVRWIFGERAALNPDGEQEGPIIGSTFLPLGAPEPKPGKLIGGYDRAALNPDGEQEDAHA